MTFRQALAYCLDRIVTWAFNYTEVDAVSSEIDFLWDIEDRYTDVAGGLRDAED